MLVWGSEFSKVLAYFLNESAVLNEWFDFRDGSPKNGKLSSFYLAPVIPSCYVCLPWTAKLVILKNVSNLTVSVPCGQTIQWKSMGNETVVFCRKKNANSFGMT